MRLLTFSLFENFAERVSLNTWEQLAGMIVRWYVIALVSFVVLWAILVLSGGNAYNMVTNMIIGVSGVIAIIIVFEVLKRRVKVSD
jgi:hypothetical protein